MLETPLSLSSGLLCGAAGLHGDRDPRDARERRAGLHATAGFRLGRDDTGVSNLNSRAERQTRRPQICVKTRTKYAAIEIKPRVPYIPFSKLKKSSHFLQFSIELKGDASGLHLAQARGETSSAFDFYLSLYTTPGGGLTRLRAICLI